jgi:3-oxoacyl-[acyl-carrier-protein] synthase-3
VDQRAFVGVEAIAHALPALEVSSEQIAQRHNFDLNFVSTKLGISNRYYLDADGTVSAMASQAVHSLLRKANLSPADVQALVVVTQTPDYCLPHTSAIVQAEAKISTDALVFDIGLGCSGYVLGLSVLCDVMASQGMTRGILVTADAYSRIMDPEDRNTSPLFGDGASATLISDHPRYTVGRTTHGSDGSRHAALIVRGSGTTPGERGSLFMDGRAIFNFALSEVPQDIDKCLEMNGLDRADIDLFVFHQANAFMITSLAQRLGVPMDRVVLSMRDVGNTTSSTIPIALEREVLSLESLPRRVLICGFGVGLSWGTTILTRVNGAGNAA